MATGSNAQLAFARAHAADGLEAAIVAAGRALEEYKRATAALEFRTNLELDRYVQNAIVLHLARAGVGELLERKLASVPPSLRLLVEQQHRRSSVSGLRAE
jgi:hypothetical protein